MATITLTQGSRSKVILINGEVLSRDISLDVPTQDALRYLGDDCLNISFDPSERTDLEQIEPSLLTRLSKALRKDFSTHEDLCNYLLPEAKVTKTLTKAKKSSLSE